jgi:predicted RNA-binding Zn ribbon-like protein
MPELSGERLLLDLLNTTPVTAGVIEDALRHDGQAAPWAVERGGVGTAGEVDSLRALRRLLQAVVRGSAPATALAPAASHVHLHLSAGESGLTWQFSFDDPDHRLASRILLTWGEVARRMPGRLRACANHDCGLFLLDRSNSNNARWCSMSRCGNRMKSRRHYQRARRPGQ